MRLKVLLIGALLLFSTASFAWPPLPKAIAVGNGVYASKNTETPFLWGVMQSLAKKDNIYILISTSVTESDRAKLESKLEVILQDEGSTVLRVKTDTSKKQPREIVKIVTEKISDICPGIYFDTDSSKY